MRQIKNLQSQHERIKEDIRLIKECLQEQNTPDIASQLAKSISTLAGRLKIHMNSEDQYLYPQLLESQNEKIHLLAKIYTDEMAGIFDVFKTFYAKYNTANKITNDKDNFLTEVKAILEQLEHRISKEEKELFPLISSL